MLYTDYVIIINIAANHLQLCVIVQGLYQVELRLLGYENPTQTSCGNSGHRRCCDSTGTSGCTEWRRCDSYFTYCLRSFGNESSQEGGCFDTNEKMISSINTDDRDDESIDFSQSTVLGLDNPFHLQGLSNDYTVSSLVLLSVYVARTIFVVVQYIIVAIDSLNSVCEQNNQ